MKNSKQFMSLFLLVLTSLHFPSHAETAKTIDSFSVEVGYSIGVDTPSDATSTSNEVGGSDLTSFTVSENKTITVTDGPESANASANLTGSYVVSGDTGVFTATVDYKIEGSSVGMETGEETMADGLMGASLQLTTNTAATLSVNGSIQTVAQSPSDFVMGFMHVSYPGSAPVRLATATNTSNPGIAYEDNLEPGNYSFSIRLEFDSPGRDKKGISSMHMASAQASVTITMSPEPTKDVYWSEAENGDFEDGEKWEPMVVPGQDNVAIFDEEGAYAVSVGDQTVSKLFVRRGDVSFISGVLSALSGSSEIPSFIVGDSEVDPATLNLATLDLITEFASIGFSPSSVGTVNIDDPASSWNGNWITVGDSGQGSLNISNGAPIVTQEIYIGRFEGSHGEFRYTGSGVGKGETSDLQAVSTTVGLAGEGDLHLMNTQVETGDLFVGTLLGASGILEVQSSILESQEVSIGLSAGSIGSATIQGEPLETPSWTAESLNVGARSPGSLTVLDGNTFSVAGDIDLGLLSGGNAKVSVLGQSSEDDSSSLGTPNGRLIVGGNGTASLFVEDGGTLAASEVIVGESPEGSIGGLIGVLGQSQSGEPSRLIVLGETFRIGGIGGSPNQITGTLAIELGGEVLCVNASIGEEGGTAGASVGEDSVWELSGDLVAGRADATVDPPIPLVTVKILNDGFISAQTMTFEIGSELSGGGIYDASDFFDFAGVLNPGPEEDGLKGPTRFAVMRFEGTFNMDRGEFILDVGGADVSMTDRIAIIGDANITGGTVTFNFVDGFLPQTGEMIPFLDISGNTVFENVQTVYTGAADGFEYDLVEQDGMLILEALNDAQPEVGPNADLDGDGEVDASDLLIFLDQRKD